ncbi:hypothetical protein BV25DRAFT_428577 [Artomyces pyxidatus]|uniref:Uncharacterized protein n=1 Tax=Artomyces pyxidatus TaxID=48021 RepID=A0ACB8T5M1_9AGAM|nr:hypothetical protein BV25DRAFT_428577 [Artomyces pyxidatus]
MAGIAIWLVPSSDESTQLQTLMARHPTPKSPASYAHFHPHITLASVPSASTDVPTLTASIPKWQPILSVHFSAVVSGNHYYRSVYAAIAPTPALAALHAHIHATLGDADAPNTPAFPHMSLYYIADEEPEERDRMLQEMVSMGVVVPVKEGEGSGVELDCGVGTGADRDALTRLGGFTGSEVWIVDCDGPVEGWTPLKKLRLTTEKPENGQVGPLDVFD